MNRRRPSQHAEAPPNAHDMELVVGLITERESEYARISHFLHDEVGQVLSAVGLQLDALRHDFGAAAPELDERTGEIQQLLETIIGRIRDLSYELNPSVVQRTGLQFALERLTSRFRDLFTGGIRLQLDPSVRVPADRAEAMYRGAEAVIELAHENPESTHLDIQLKRNRNDFVLEIRADAIIDFEEERRLPVLLMSYYTSRNDITLAVNRSGEKDTIVNFSCAANQ